MENEILDSKAVNNFNDTLVCLKQPLLFNVFGQHYYTYYRYNTSEDVGRIMCLSELSNNHSELTD